MKKIFLASLFSYLAALYPTTLNLSGTLGSIPTVQDTDPNIRTASPPKTKASAPSKSLEPFSKGTPKHSIQDTESSPFEEEPLFSENLDSSKHDESTIHSENPFEEFSPEINLELSTRLKQFMDEKKKEKSEKGELRGLSIPTPSTSTKMSIQSKAPSLKAPKDFMPYLGQTLVEQKGDKYILNPIFQRAHESLLQLINRGYCATRKDEKGKLLYPELLEETDEEYNGLRWHISPPVTGLSGVNKHTGNSRILNILLSTTELDFGVYIAIHKSPDPRFPHIIAIVIRGSEGKITGASWITNFAATKQMFFFGTNRLRLHNGYYLRHETFKPDLATKLREQTEALSFSKEDLEKTIIVVTGHSQGGGVAPITFFWMATEGARSILGINQPNRIWLYALSPARCCGDRETAEVFHTCCNKNNMLSHGVSHDLVMAVPLGEKTTKYLRILFIPYTLAALLDHPLGFFVTLGTRAYDHAQATFMRYLELYPTLIPFAKKKCKKFIAKHKSGIKTVTQLKALYKKFYAPYAESLGESLEDYYKWFLYYKVWKRRVIPIKFSIVFSHYGSNWTGGSYVFDPKLPQQGQELLNSIARGKNWSE